MTKFASMSKSVGGDQPGYGNLSILTKVDKLRELIGTRIALPQLVAVGDQSSGKSSVLENLTGFAFPRDAELCTRYATQITCRREAHESISVSIMVNPDATPDSRARVKDFHRTFTELSPENLAQLFKEANEAMGISSGSTTTTPDGFPLPAFSEHILKIEKLGPNEEHFTVIDVPGIFRQETQGVTTENDIELVMNMVKKYIHDSRTIILAIMPSNVDPATQEILKLAKKADPTMTRTMAVLTKPDLAIEKVTQQIAIDHVIGKRGDLALGYYVVKNRGPDDVGMTLEQGQVQERIFFSNAPWSALAHTGRAGIGCLKQRVRDLLIDLIKKEFPKLKAEITKELGIVRAHHDEMGPSRSDQHTQRAYLNRMSEAFQSLTRDALKAYYVGDEMFSHRHDLRLITRVVEAIELYAKDMLIHGHTRPFLSDNNDDLEGREALIATSLLEPLGKSAPEKAPGGHSLDFDLAVRKYPELEEIFDSWDCFDGDTKKCDIMEYIEDVYKSSRGQDLGTFGNGLLGTLFKEQSKEWESITLKHVSVIIYHVHHFICEAVKSICPDPRVHEELWNGYLLEELMDSYRRGMDHARFLLRIEREGSPLTLTRSFTTHIQKKRTNRLIEAIRGLGIEGMGYAEHAEHDPLIHRRKKISKRKGDDNHILLQPSTLQDLNIAKGDEAHIREEMHNLLSSYYEVARERFVDVVYQQVVNHCLLFGDNSPLSIFNTEMVLGLNEEQLDMIAAEDSPVKQRRDKLLRDIENLTEARKVLKGSR
ncbi:interferon-induced GTP-binding protein Mx2 [Xylaria digitata]|nr:interferon-induced GTP-binding protein Mx2 [Xylaria digitata]